MLRLLSITSTACSGRVPSNSWARSAKNGWARAKPDEQHRQRPQQQHDQIADLQDPPAALQGLAQELHGRPMHDAVPPAVQQVDDDRDRRRQIAPATANGQIVKEGRRLIRFGFVGSRAGYGLAVLARRLSILPSCRIGR